MGHDVFVSHSEKDKAVADAVVSRLEAESVTCWTAPRDVVPGADWGESIINAIESSRIMILIFSESANASPQVRREVERAVNKGVYIIPFRVHNIPPARSLEYFISSSQWMDAFSPPLERHLDNLAKTVKAVLKRPPLAGARMSAQAEKTSIPTPPIRPASWRKPIFAAVAIGGLVILGIAGWYLVRNEQVNRGTPLVGPTATSTPVPMTPTAVTSPIGASTISDDEVRSFVTNHYRAEERRDLDYLLSQYAELVDFRKYRWRDKAFIRDTFVANFKRYPVHSYTVSDIRVVPSALQNTITAYFELKFFSRDPASGRSHSGHASDEWVISKTSGALKIVSERGSLEYDEAEPSITPQSEP